MVRGFSLVENHSLDGVNAFTKSTLFLAEISFIASAYSSRLAFSFWPFGRSNSAERSSKAMGDTMTRRGAEAPLYF
jgi:hypothetical protein